MGSLHSVRPWSFMQAALHGGAATWRPTTPWAGGVPVRVCTAFAVTGVINERTSSAVNVSVFVMIGSFESRIGQRRKIFHEIHLRKLTRSLEGVNGRTSAL